jgi:hypothetical protein
MIGVQFSAGTRVLSLLHSGPTGLEAYPASNPVAAEGTSPGVRRPQREVDHSNPILKLRMVNLYLCSSIHIPGPVIN